MLAQFSQDYVLVGVRINRIFGMFGSRNFFEIPDSTTSLLLALTRWRLCRRGLNTLECFLAVSEMLLAVYCCNNFGR